MTNPADRIDLIGRVLLSSIFIISGVMKFADWNQTLGFVSSQGVPWPDASLFLAAGIEIFAGLGVLLGYATRASAFLLFLYLIPVTLVFHAFWALPGPEMQMQLVNFMKNLTIMGGLLVLAANGARRFSLDARKAQQIGEDERGRRLRAA